MLDTVEITIPRERDFSIVAELVTGGIAARHDLTLEALDDLQLALGSLLEHDEDGDGRSASCSVSATARSTSRSGLSARAPSRSSNATPARHSGLRRLLDSTVDDASVSERVGGSWVDLRKGFPTAEPPA